MVSLPNINDFEYQKLIHEYRIKFYNYIQNINNINFDFNNFEMVNIDLFCNDVNNYTSKISQIKFDFYDSVVLYYEILNTEIDNPIVKIIVDQFDTIYKIIDETRKELLNNTFSNNAKIILTSTYFYSNMKHEISLLKTKLQLFAQIQM